MIHNISAFCIFLNNCFYFILFYFILFYFYKKLTFAQIFYFFSSQSSNNYTWCKWLYNILFSIFFIWSFYSSIKDLTQPPNPHNALRKIISIWPVTTLHAHPHFCSQTCRHLNKRSLRALKSALIWRSVILSQIWLFFTQYSSAVASLGPHAFFVLFLKSRSSLLTHMLWMGEYWTRFSCISSPWST